VSSVLRALVAFVVTLGPLVFVHELGHFLVAKGFRIGVPVFSLGFGPRLFGLRRRETDYRVSLIPLGGYVRLTGDESDEERQGRADEFLSRPKWQRLLVFAAGAAFNVLLAFLVFWLLFAAYGKDEVPIPDDYPKVQFVAEGSPAARAGLRPGDRLMSIAGRDLRGGEAFEEVYNVEIMLAPGTRKPLLVERDGKPTALELEVGADPKFGHGSPPGWSLSWGADQAPVILAVNPGSPAEAVGLRAGDRVLAANGREPISEFDLRALLAASAGEPVQLVIERGAEKQTLSVVPQLEEDKGRIGVQLGLPPVHRDLGLMQAARESVRANLANSLMLFRVLKRMLTRELPLRSVSGPIGIAQVAQQALFESPRHFLWLLGFFSLQLGILNLLPIPVLDGGHILILAIEGVMRRDLSDRVKERVMQVGFVFLLAFMSVVVYLDFLKL
jgi:regulator of sigma E protease